VDQVTATRLIVHSTAVADRVNQAQYLSDNRADLCKLGFQEVQMGVAPGIQTVYDLECAKIRRKPMHGAAE
jgi:hypothetical protein